MVPVGWSLAALQAAPGFGNLSTQGVGLRPRPWALFSRPVGPDGPGACALGKPVRRGRDVPSPFHDSLGRPTPSGRLRGGNPGPINPNPWRGRDLVLSGENGRRYRPVVGSRLSGGCGRRRDVPP